MTYADHAPALLAAGWCAVVPLPAREKFPPPTGYTGAEGRVPDHETVEKWAANRPDANLALVLHPGVLALDVDAHDGKQGAATLAAAVEAWGPLPATYGSTSRPGTPSGHRLFRVPVDLIVGYGELPQGRHVDLIRHGHRYLVAPGSTHPEGRAYVWTDRAGTVVEDGFVPGPGDLAELPAAWVEGLAAPVRSQDQHHDDVLLDQVHTAVVGPTQGHPDRLRAYTDRVVEAELTRLDDLTRTGWNGPGWDATTHSVACNLLELANSPWCPAMGGELHAAFLSRAPVDTTPGRAFNGHTHERKWRAAEHTVAGKGRPEPVDRPLDGAGLSSERGFADDSVVSTDTSPSTGYAHDVAAEAYRLRVREGARDVLREEEAARRPVDLDDGTLDEVAARVTPTPFRIEGLLPAGGHVTLIAQRKTGKTTTLVNLTRSLLSGEKFLGRFAVRAIDPARRVGVLNYEMSAETAVGWFADAGIDPARVYVANLRGLPNPLATTHGRALLAARLREHGVDVLLIDTFGRAFTGESQDSNSDVGAFLHRTLDEFLVEAGIGEAVLTVHAGWNGERSRGASALEDWPDALWRLRRNADDEDGPRYFSADGRDVDVEEDALTFDLTTRTLALTGTGGRTRPATGADRRVEDLTPDVLADLAQAPGGWPAAIANRLRADGRKLRNGDVNKVLDRLLVEGRVTVTAGLYNRKHYRLTGPTCDACHLPLDAVEAGQSTHPGCDPGVLL